MSVPRLATERLVMRGFDERDFDEYAAIMADPDVTRYLLDGRPLGRAEAWRQMAMIMGHWALRGFGLWAVEEQGTGALMGRIGCFEPEGWPGLEVGYVLARRFWGRGYATEGARAALRYAREVLRRDRVISLIRPENVSSMRVAERVGAVAEGEIDFYGGPVRVYLYPGVALPSR